MASLNRRDFLQRTAAGVAATALTAGRATAQPAAVTATTVRPIGKTGITCTLLGMGTGVRSWNGVSELTKKGRKTYLAMLEHAYASGLRYFDMADMYGAHQYMREALGRTIERDKVTLLSKLVQREPAGLRADIERIRKELDTEYLDILLLHCMTAGDWPEKLAPAMAVFDEAKAKGIIRAQGVSCHSLDALKRAAESDWVDVILARINPFGVKMDGPVEEVVAVLRQAHAAGKGVLGMKILGEGEIRDKMVESLRFAIGLGCVDAMPIGFLTFDEIDSAIQAVETAQQASG